MSSLTCCERGVCGMRNTTFPPSPPASPLQKDKELPVRSYIPTDDQIHEAISRAKLGMGRNQDSTAKVWSWIRDREPTWALTEKRLRKIAQEAPREQSFPPSPPAEPALPTDACCAFHAERARNIGSYGQQTAPKRPGHRCKVARRRKSAPVPEPIAPIKPLDMSDQCSDHAGCGPKCAVWRAKMLDKRLDALDCEWREVLIRVRISAALVEKAALDSDSYVDLQLHVFEDAVTGSEYVLAPELVRSYLPTVCKAGGTLMHSIYTYNHAYGRGTPISRSACCDWRAWAGCPQALAKKASSVSSESDMERARERIWLVDGQAEVLIGPECEPDKETIDPAIVSSKGKNRARVC